ncbi:unnamed protein product [Parnassius apollo]|uniref:(apollo) hypothetical protein n=1 Tax=Parnassius apollo TaxID=110799 RepID=A0A8S3X3K1_PARAO|nr:unnamed protein product [Parnassius apollo]
MASRFPSNLTERNKWLNNVELKRPFFEKAKICNLHFKSTNYMIKWKRLRQGVTPFLNEIADCSLVQVADKSTSPIQIYCADKSVQARIKSSREEELMIRNKSLVQKRTVR